MSRRRDAGRLPAPPPRRKPLRHRLQIPGSGGGGSWGARVPGCKQLIVGCSLAVGPRGNVVVSFNFLNQIVSIAAGFGSFEWRLGGPNATIEVADEYRFSGQHTAAEIGEGRVLMFDNGFERAEDYSRALEVELNGALARKIWEFRPPDDNWSRAISSARRLPNGHTFVTFGMSQGLLGPADQSKCTK